MHIIGVIFEIRVSPRLMWQMWSLLTVWDRSFEKTYCQWMSQSCESMQILHEWGGYQRKYEESQVRRNVDSERELILYWGLESGQLGWNKEHWEIDQMQRVFEVNEVAKRVQEYLMLSHAVFSMLKRIVPLMQIGELV